MVTYPISDDCLIFSIEKDEHFVLRQAISEALGPKLCAAWDDIEADFFTLSDRTLIIARPRTPLTQRVNSGTPRLFRI